jgi:hypothetical protein
MSPKKHPRENHTYGWGSCDTCGQGFVMRIREPGSEGFRSYHRCNPCAVMVYEKRVKDGDWQPARVVGIGRV